MSFYELDRPAAPAPGIFDRVGSFFTAIGNMGNGAMHSIAYARMMRVMYEMDDATLARIGVTRAQIPAHVEKCLSDGRGF